MIFDDPELPGGQAGWCVNVSMNSTPDCHLLASSVEPLREVTEALSLLLGGSLDEQEHLAGLIDSDRRTNEPSRI